MIVFIISICPSISSEDQDHSLSWSFINELQYKVLYSFAPTMIGHPYRGCHACLFTSILLKSELCSQSDRR